jgi:hypothetical protein
MINNKNNTRKSGCGEDFTTILLSGWKKRTPTYSTQWGSTFLGGAAQTWLSLCAAGVVQGGGGKKT